MLRIFVTIILTFVFAAALFAGGETETLRYRRWLAPIEQIENWPFPPGLNLPVNRQLFEQYVQQSVTKCQLSESSAAAFFKTVLTADIDGEKPFPNKSLQGSGTFELPPQRANPDSIPLVPLNIPVIGAKWSDGTEASFVNSANGTLHLVVPNQTVKRLDFRWSLQNKMPVEDSPVFDFALPLSLQSELHFDIPETMTAVSTGGIVLSETHNTPQRKLCRILLGQETKTTVSFQQSNSTGGIRSGGKVPYRQTVSYRLTEQGLDVIVQFFFSKSNVRLNELFAEVDEPLQIAEVRCGTEFNSIAVPWQRQTLSSSQIIRIDLSGVSSEMISGLTLRAVSPMQENTDWKLPGVRLKQDNVFWCETRCGVNVFAPLQAAEVFVTDGVQVVPRTVVDAAQRELFTFQFFKPEAFATLKAVYSEPQMSYQSATQIYWGANEIRANAVLECRAEQDKLFAVELPVVENWTVDSVKCFSLPKELGTFTPGNILLDSLTGSEADNTASWNIWNDPEKKNVQKLQIQFKSPLESKSPVIVQLTGRYLKNTQQKFQLETLSPVKVPLRKNTVHLIGVQIEDIPYRLRSADGISTATAAQQKSLQRLTGGVFVLNSGTQTSALELVRAEPDYTAEIAENVALTDNGLAVTVLVRCQPVQSSADRIYVYFSSKNSGGRTWNWTSSDSRLQPLRAKKLSDKEVSDLLPVFKTKVRLEDLQQGETWEIRLPSLQTETFDLQAAATLPLEESITVPLAALPAALSQNAAQKAVLTVVSPHRFDYRIVNSRLQSIPAAAADWNQYSEIQAVFRYSPDEELRRPGQIPLSLQKLQPNETANSAWIWSLRLNSQYEPEGNIKNNTLLCVENRGRKKIRITLPAGINAADISSVLCAGRPADWFSGSEELPDGGKRCSLTVALPEGRRFVTITVEYAYQDIPLTQQRKLRPRYLTADVPVLSGTWTAWFPPEYDVHLHRSASDQPVSPYAHGLSKCLTYWGRVKTFNLVSAEDWRRLFTQRQRNSEAAEIADKFFAEMDAALKKNQITSWGNLLKNDKILANTVFRIGEGTDVKLLVDKQAFRLIGITPATPVSSLITASPARAGSLSEELFDQNGLVLLVSSRLRADKVREYTLGITSPLRLPLYRDIQSERAGHCVRSVAAQIFEPAVKGGTNLSIQPVWDSPVYWVNETVISASPWLATPPFSSALSTDWKAVELPTEREQSLNIVHRETMAALQWLAFLAAVLITSRKIFSSPVLIILLLCVTETITRCTADCYVMIPAGIFLGLCVSLGFTLIRSRIVKPEIPLDTSLVKVSDSTEYDKNFVPTAIVNRNFTTDILLFVTIICCGTAAAAEMPQKEAYRVFYPTDSEKNITGSEVWLPYEFLKILSQPQRPAAALSSGDVQKHWSIVSSTYRGSLITAEPNFTADFVILLNGSEAEITLGKLPILSAAWDGKAIEAVRRQNGKETVTALMVSNELPGKHTLSVRIGTENLAKNSAGNPGTVNGAAKIIEFPIPKIPNSTLHLNVPADMTGIRFDGICGAVQRTDGSGEYVVDTGAAENISIALDAEKSAFSGTAAALFAAGPAAEEYLWLWAKPAQTELKTLFRLQFDGSQTLLNNVTEISIKTDSRWLLSGQFQCDSVPVSSQTLAGQDGSDVTQITFLSPPSGTVTLRADFVLQDFNGIGNVLMPQFQVLQTKTVKKMLAVSAENNLELVFPPSGQSSGFLSAWYGEGQPGTPSGIRSTALPNTAAPAAQYDITQIGGDWVLGIQAKKILPDVKVQTDVLFDTKESVFVTSGLFETSAGVFQLPFLAASTAAIERIEVRDAQPGPNFDTLLACRYSINAASADTNRGIIFLRRPASGKISVTITGTFTGSGKEPEVFTAVPALVFTNCNVKEHTLNLFRRNSVLTAIQDEPHGWTKPSITPSVPEFFSKGEAVIPLAQYDADSRTAYAAGIAAQQLPVMPKVLVKANEPKLQGETRLTLNQENGSWSIDYGISGEISGGEFTQFRLHWDERCRNILSAGVSFAGNTVQPCNWSWEQTEGRYVLMLSPASFPNKPFTGKIRLNIKAFLAQGTDDVSVPAIFPDIDTSAVQMFVQLPQKNGEETIPWELQYLETYQTKNAANTDGSGKAQLLFRVTDKDYRAKINRTNSAPVITLCDAGFLLRPDGSLLALAAADVKVSGQDTCIVQLPVNSELIQMTRNGTVLRGTQLGNNRWQIDFWGSDYPQRLNILYRSRLRCALPVFEGVKVQETIWTIAKETAGAPPLDYAVQTAQNTSAADNNENTLIDLGRHKFLTGNTAVQSQITMNLIRQHHLLRQLNSLPVSTGRLEEVKRWFTHWSADWNSVSEKINYQTALTANEPNVKPVLLLDWRERQDIDQNASTAAFLETMSAKTRDALQLAKQQSVKEKIDSSSKEPEASVSGSENIGSNVPLLNSQTYWQGRLSGEMVYLFGVSGGAVSEICLTDDSQLSRSTGGIRFWQSILPAQMPLAVQMLLGISLCVFTAIMVMIFLRRIYFTELLLQYPHFWGMALGLFLWSSTPLGGVGIAVTVLTVISLFRPSWHRRKIPKNT